MLYVVCECIFRTCEITDQIQHIICRNNIAKAHESSNFRFATFGGKRVWNVYITKACGTQRPFSVKCLGRCRMSIMHFCHINIKRGCKFVTSFLKIIKIKSAQQHLQLSLLSSCDALTNNKRSLSLLTKNNTLEIHTDRRITCSN